MLEQIGDFVSTVGFPVAVAGFLLWKMNGKLERLTSVIEKLIETLNRHAEEKEEE